MVGTYMRKDPLRYRKGSFPDHLFRIDAPDSYLICPVDLIAPPVTTKLLMEPVPATSPFASKLIVLPIRPLNDPLLMHVWIASRVVLP